MKLFTQSMIYNLCRSVGFNITNSKIGSAVALCEAPGVLNNAPVSNFAAIGDQELANDTWGYSYGGFQIRSLRAHKGTGQYRDEERLLDPAFNARSARKIKLDRGNWTAWTCYTTGQYKPFLPEMFPELFPADNAPYYIVVSGDSLSKIAAKKGLDWHDIARWNNIHDPYIIRVGQIILLSDPVGA